MVSLKDDLQQGHLFDLPPSESRLTCFNYSQTSVRAKMNVLVVLMMMMMIIMLMKMGLRTAEIFTLHCRERHWLSHLTTPYLSLQVVR